MKRILIAVLAVGLGCSAPLVDTHHNDGGQCGPTPAQHRPSTVCSDPRPASEGCPGGGSCRGCVTDSDCTGGRNGRCVSGRAGFYCSYDLCAQDSDCTGGEICGCRLAAYQGANWCVSGSCTVDSDCGPCGFCSPSLNGCETSYFCHTAADECTNDSDCTQPGALCSFTPTVGHWKCALTTCSG